MYSRPSQLQQAKIQNISKSQTFFKARSNTAKNKNINRLPYGGQLLCEAEIINELIDHNQYYRVLKQPSPEQLRKVGKPVWELADQDRFSTLKHRQSLVDEDIKKKKEEY